MELIKLAVLHYSVWFLYVFFTNIGRHDDMRLSVAIGGTIIVTLLFSIPTFLIHWSLK